jgi:hypothetical protein
MESDPIEFMEMAPPFTYEYWARIPSSDYKQGWYSGEKIFEFEDLEECAVHTLAHECFESMGSDSMKPAL